jgi:hypothetical protein
MSIQEQLTRLKNSVTSQHLTESVRAIMQRRIAELEADLTAVNSQGGADVRFQATEDQPERQQVQAEKEKPAKVANPTKMQERQERQPKEAEPIKPKPVISYKFEHAPETEQRVIVSANLTDRFAKVMDSDYFLDATDLNRVVARKGFQTLLTAFRAKKEQIEAEAERLGVKLSIQTQDCYPRYYEASDDYKASADLLFNILIKYA